ncbi:MAG: SDR family NAD(P)-dependent oxidoreductase [Lachnospiraceae bacterium]|nr:SDR family NAD(P)-dependent oxidoreductase [Lachnospiraceae bacterium]
MRIALITGASSGLGMKFAREIDAKEKKIDEIWLVARREDRLKETAEGISKKTRIFPLDLLKRESFDNLENALREADARVGILIVNAGFAKIGNYSKVTRRDSDNMIDLNCRAAVDTTVTCLPFMKAGDRIIEICSTAAFQPLQHINIYAATKTFLYNYSRALRMELLPRKIAVTAVCPYWMKDTEFLPVANDNEANAAPDKSISNFNLGVPSDKVAKRALAASRRGAAVSTPGFICTIHRFFGKILPRTFMMYIWEGFRKL